MIYYNPMHGGWEDEEDESFFVDMTTEGTEGTDELDKEFETQDEFFKWYHGE